MTTTLSAGQTIADLDQRLIDMRSALEILGNETAARMADEIDAARERHEADQHTMAARHKAEIAGITAEFDWFGQSIRNQIAAINAARGDDAEGMVVEISPGVKMAAE